MHVVDLDCLIPCSRNIPFIRADSQSVDLLGVRSKASQDGSQPKSGRCLGHGQQGSRTMRAHRFWMLYRPAADPAPCLPEANGIVVTARAQSVQGTSRGRQTGSLGSWRPRSHLQHRHSRISLRLLLLWLLLVMRVRARVVVRAAALRHPGICLRIYNYARHAGGFACRKGKSLRRRKRRRKRALLALSMICRVGPMSPWREETKAVD